MTAPPAARLEPVLRAQLQADAIKLAKASKYCCAGTVEFLVQPESGDYFFIECNPRIQVRLTRIFSHMCLFRFHFSSFSGAVGLTFWDSWSRVQVEHTVTEQVTGVDLVESQFKLAGGATLADLGLSQDSIATRGYAIQARVVATGTGTLSHGR